MDPRVIPNFSVSVDLMLGQAAEDLSVPLESVFRENDRDVAYVRRTDGWERRELRLGLTNHIAAAVLSGLHEGEVVAAERPVRAILP
jgi:hypothetical protein